MKAVVVDTNVCVVANGRSPQADPPCEAACLAALKEAQDGGLVVIDDNYQILKEYRQNLLSIQQPGPGSQFLLWLLQNLGNDAVCERVRITPKPGAEDNFAEFPSDPELGSFDRSDRKFVAVARASAHAPPILNAVDRRSWPVYRDCLAQHGVQVECLCPHLTRE